MGYSKYEFGGPVGAVGMLVGLPLTVLCLNLMCNPTDCALSEWSNMRWSQQWYDPAAVMIYLGWIALHFTFAVLPIGQIHEGLPLSDGKRLKYRCNAFAAFVISVLCFVVLFMLDYPVTIIYDKFLPLAMTSIVFSSLLSILLYIKSYIVDSRQLAHGGNTGNFLYDFFIGRELNPRIGPLDLKFVCELRPGLIGWTLINLSFIAQSWKMYGTPNPALVLVALFEIFYVADACWHEPAILSTMDIIHDGFGFMLAFGDLAWVPFLYCLNARFLVEHPQDWNIIALIGFVLLKICGFIIFRGANSQKDAFRQNPHDPKLAYLESIPTESGKRLLVSGWWGMCRHPNYLGDLTMALSWSLPSGFHIIPYFYPIYFFGLLIHRNLRDEWNCKKKYGADWDKYCKLVPYRIFPYIW